MKAVFHSVAILLLVLLALVLTTIHLIIKPALPIALVRVLKLPINGHVKVKCFS